MAYGLLPERTHPPFVALAVKVDLGRLFEIEMLDTHIGHLLDARPGIVEK